MSKEIVRCWVFKRYRSTSDRLIMGLHGSLLQDKFSQSNLHKTSISGWISETIVRLTECVRTSGHASRTLSESASTPVLINITGFRGCTFQLTCPMTCFGAFLKSPANSTFSHDEFLLPRWIFLFWISHFVFPGHPQAQILYSIFGSSAWCNQLPLSSLTSSSHSVPAHTYTCH